MADWPLNDCAKNVILLKYGKMEIVIISSPPRKYRKSYCSHPGVGVAQNVKVFGLSFYESISLEVGDGSS